MSIPCENNFDGRRNPVVDVTSPGGFILFGTAEHRIVELVGDFVAGARDADERHASVNQYLHRIFSDISPADLTAAEAAALVEAFGPAFRRVSGTTVNQGAPGVPHGIQLGQILAHVTPADLVATEALLVLTIMIPAHSRAIVARSSGTSGRPTQRLLLAPLQ